MMSLLKVTTDESVRVRPGAMSPAARECFESRLELECRKALSKKCALRKAFDAELKLGLQVTQPNHFLHEYRGVLMVLLGP